MDSLANNEESDEMQHYAAFHQGLHSGPLFDKIKTTIRDRNTS